MNNNKNKNKNKTLDRTDESAVANLQKNTLVNLGKNNEDRSTTDGNLGGELELERTLTNLHSQITNQEGQILTELGNLDELHGLSSDSFKGTSVTDELGDLHLGSDEEADVTMIPASSKSPEEDTTLRDDTQAQKGVETAQEEATPKLVRQNAVVATTNPPPDLKRSRTKEEKAKNGARSSLYFLNKMAQRDPTTFTPREKVLIRRHRQDIARFERTYGPTSAILGKSIPKELLVIVEDTSSNVKEDKALSTRTNISSNPSRKEGNTGTLPKTDSSVTDSVPTVSSKPTQKGKGRNEGNTGALPRTDSSGAYRSLKIYPKRYKRRYCYRQTQGCKVSKGYDICSYPKARQNGW